MRDYINDLVEIGMGSTIDMSMNRVVCEDELYRKYMKEFEKIYDQFDEMQLTETQQEFVTEYIELLQAANIRACNLTYLMGIKKTFSLLEKNGMLIEAIKSDQA